MWMAAAGIFALWCIAIGILSLVFSVGALGGYVEEQTRILALVHNILRARKGDKE